MRRLPAGLLALLLLLLLGTGSAAAVKPTMFTISIDDHFVDPTICRFDVTVDASGHIRFAQYFDKAGNVFMEINNFAVRISYSSNGQTVNVVDTGVDLVKYASDGSLTIAVTGNIQLATDEGAGVISGSAGRTLFLLTPTGEVDAEGFPIYDVAVVSEKGKRTIGDICTALD